MTQTVTDSKTRRRGSPRCYHEALRGQSARLSVERKQLEGKHICFELAAKSLTRQRTASNEVLGLCALLQINSRQSSRECSTQHPHTVSMFIYLGVKRLDFFAFFFLALLPLDGTVGSRGSIRLQISDAAERSNRDGVSEYASPQSGPKTCVGHRNPLEPATPVCCRCRSTRCHFDRPQAGRRH